MVDNVKELLLLRHAKSSWDNAHLSDFERPLNERGRYDAPRIGRLLRQADLVPELIITSSAVRAATTAEWVAEAAGYEGEIRAREGLYLAEPETYLAVLKKEADPYGRVMIVGHNPTMEEMVEMLAGRGERMPTGAVAHFQLSIVAWDKFSSSTSVTLLNVWWPRELRG